MKTFRRSDQVRLFDDTLVSVLATLLIRFLIVQQKPFDLLVLVHVFRVIYHVNVTYATKYRRPSFTS